MYVEKANAMEPTIKVGQRVTLDMRAYKSHAPGRWEVVAFKHPESGDPKHEPFSIMRIVGLPGETIQIEPTDVIINGQRLEVPSQLKHLKYGGIKAESSRTKTGRALPVYPLTIPQGCYFVLGDNSEVAYDSRFWGVLSADAIVGKIVSVP